MESYSLYKGNVLNAYEKWPAPDLIISDGAYGVRGFHGDTTGTDGLVEWYQPHALAWSSAAKPSTSLWFWNTEVGWATLHPLLVSHGWDYVQTVVWDKGLSHIAGNVNGRTIRQLPIVTEVAVLYRRRIVLACDDGEALPVQQWLRQEWRRSGLPLSRSNEACGVRNAATRKYLTQDWLWYWPPGDMVVAMATYATRHGKFTKRPYFSLDGKTPLTAMAWDDMRARWNHEHGLTNVWSRPPLNDSERLKGTLERAAPRVYRPTAQSAAHLNQKPLEFMTRQVAATTGEDDLVWEPFGGLASGSVAAVTLGRRAVVAEVDPTFQKLAAERLRIARSALTTSRKAGTIAS